MARLSSHFFLFEESSLVEVLREEQMINFDSKISNSETGARESIFKQKAALSDKELDMKHLIVLEIF